MIIQRPDGILSRHAFRTAHVCSAKQAQDAHVGAPLRGRPVDTCTIDVPQYGPDNKKFGVPMGEMVNWFKTMTTNEYIRGVKNQGWKRFDSKLWQRNYWEHIIRDDGSYSRIASYILQNPSKWDDDFLNLSTTVEIKI